MMSAKEQQVMNGSMRDPAFRNTWEGLCDTLDRDTLDDSAACIAKVRTAMRIVEAVLNDRPELAALVEATESESH